MNKYKKLASNSVIFAVGNLGSKLITFLLLPLYTYTLSTSQYGTADLVQTTANLLLPLISLNVFEAVLRFAMDKRENISDVLNVGVRFTVVGSIVFLILGLIGHSFQIGNALFLALIIVSQAFQSLFAQYVKAIGKVKLFAANGILLTLVTAVLDIILLIPLKMGLVGFLLALIIGTSVSDIYLFYRGRIRESIHIRNTIKNNLAHRMMVYSLPLIPNSIAWWATSTISRYFIVGYIGAAANGIFAVSNKIPSLLNVINSIFFQSWQISAIEEYDSKDTESFYSNVMNVYMQILFLGTTGIIAILKIMLSIIVSTDFYTAWKYVPFLLLSVSYSSLSSFLGQYYVAAKKTMGVFTTTIYGTLVNVVLNFFLIPKYGLFGASISAVVSYFVIFIVRYVDTKKLVKSNIDWLNFIFNHLIIAIQIFVLFTFSGNLLYGCESVLLLLSFLVNKSIVILMLKTGRSVYNHRLKR